MQHEALEWHVAHWEAQLTRLGIHGATNLMQVWPGVKSEAGVEGSGMLTVQNQQNHTCRCMQNLNTHMH